MRIHRNPWLAAGALALVLAMFGCTSAPSGDGAGAEPISESQSEMQNDADQDAVHMAAQIAGEIEADPDHATAILESHGMTSEQFQALMVEIAQDPAKSEAYAAARANDGS